MSETWELEADGLLVSETDAAMWLGDDSVVTDTDVAVTDPADTDVTGEAEFAAWLRGLPDDIRADYLSRPLAGPLETEPAGFHHHETEPGSGGIGFAAGGAHDTLPPGPDLAGLAAATDGGRAELGESALIGVLCAWQRLASWAQAGQAATLMTLVRRREAQARELHRPSLAEHVNDEVAAALRLTNRSANQLLATASGLDRLPDVYAALKRGEIDWAKACLFMDQLIGLSDDDAREIAASLLGRAGGMTCGQLRAALTRAVLAHDPEAAEQRRKEARADSGVHTWTETSGNAALAGRELATTDVIHASVRLTAFARWLRKHGATGTMDQLRAAVYIALLTGRAVDSLLPPDPDATVTSPDTAGPASPDPGSSTDSASTTGQSVPGAASSTDSTSTTGQSTAGAASSTDTASTTAESMPGAASTAGARAASTTGESKTGATSTAGASSTSDPQPATGSGWPSINGALSAAALAGSAGGWPQLTGTVNLTMPMSTWLGLTRHPGEVASLGPVDAETSRQLAAVMDPDTRWCLTLTDPAGQAVAHACASTGPPPAGLATGRVPDRAPPTCTGPPRGGPTCSEPTGGEPSIGSRMPCPEHPCGS